MSASEHNEPWLRGAEEFRGQRLLPYVIDYHAHEDPSRIFNSMPRTQNVADGFRDVDMKTMATTVNFMAWWLDGHFKDVPKEKKVLAYVGVPDIRYPVLLFAAIKAGWMTFWVSPRNPPDHNLYLLREAKVNLVLYADLMEPVVKGIQQLDSTSQISYMPVPSVDEVLNGQSHPYPYDALFADVKDERCLAMHTSGSTAGWYNGIHGHPHFLHDRYCRLGSLNYATQRSASELYYEPDDSPSPLSSPSTIEQWWTCDPDARKKAEGLDFVLFGGGPLAPSVGQKLSKLTDLCQMYGSIESGQIQMLVPHPGEWQYLEPNPAEECDMQEVEESPGLYELVLHQDEKFRGRRTLSHTFPDVKEWRTKDLFTPHPTKSGLWQFHSRTDDLIALGTSAKVFPVPMEMALQGDPNIAGALVVGNARPAVVLIIEPAQSVSDENREEFVDKIWPSVVEANAAAPTQGKISRSRILLTDPAIGFARTPKGTIARKKSEALYTAAIDAVFRDGIVDDHSSTSAFEILNEVINSASYSLDSLVHRKNYQR